MKYDSEMLDKVTFFDGWSIQIDRERDSDIIRVYLYVFHERTNPVTLELEDDYMKCSVDMITLDTAYFCLQGFFEECKAEYDGEG